MAELKKQVVEPWVAKLVGQYKATGINVVQSTATTDLGGQRAEGLRMKFFLDDTAGGAEAYWTLLDKRLVLAYFIRPRQSSRKSRAWVVDNPKKLKDRYRKEIAAGTSPYIKVPATYKH